ncbi:MAG: DNA adenine methylase [Actinomycetes bacterium]
MIKYLGSKRRLIPVLGDIFAASGATSALDLFTGTTRVAQEFKRRGGFVTAVDLARYSDIFAQCYIALDGDAIIKSELDDALAHLSNLAPEPGYFTQVFCEESRFFQPFNGARIDAIRNAIEAEYKNSPLYPILLTSLIEAADRVDSTTGVQMAYIKQWAQRSHNQLSLRVPEMLPGVGRAVKGRAEELVDSLGPFDLAYLDPPYNQHRYVTNYHIWETLVEWDAPEYYGVACKRIDSRDDSTKSVFNSKRAMPPTLFQTIESVNAEVVVLSYNNESWVSVEDLVAACSVHGHVVQLAFDSKRYVGAQIGIHSPSGKKVGAVSHLRNLEYVILAGPKKLVERMASAVSDSVAAPSS